MEDAHRQSDNQALAAGGRRQAECARRQVRSLERGGAAAGGVVSPQAGAQRHASAHRGAARLTSPRRRRRPGARKHL